MWRATERRGHRGVSVMDATWEPAQPCGLNDANLHLQTRQFTAVPSTHTLIIVLYAILK